MFILRTNIITLFFLFYSTMALSQRYSISGRIIDGDTKKPVDSAIIYVFGTGFGNYTVHTTDESGKFKVDNLSKRRYHLQINRREYQPLSTVITIEDSSGIRDVILFAVNSPNQNFIDDVAEQDNYHGAFAVNFLAMKNESERSTFKSQMNIEWTYSFKRKLTRFDQLGVDLTPAKFSWYSLKNDTVITYEIYEKEKYFAYYVSAFAYNRLLITRQKANGFPGFFFDIGVGYDFPVVFQYNYKKDAGSKGSKSGIHNYKEFSGLMRLGFDVFSMKATYRFFDILKKNYPEPSKLKFGLEINFPERYL